MFLLHSKKSLTVKLLINQASLLLKFTAVWAVAIRQWVCFRIIIGVLLDCLKDTLLCPKMLYP